MILKEKDTIKTDVAWDLLCQRIEAEGLLPEKNRSNHRHTILKWMTACAMLLLIVTGWWMAREMNVPHIELLTLQNEANAPTLATMLEDGSVVCLSGRTLLRYPGQFAEDRREVILQGEAFFDIAGHAERPFIIETDLATVEVLGTSFSVKSEDLSAFLLSVYKGEVKITLKKESQTIHVKAGEVALFDSNRLQLLQTNTRSFDEYVKYIHFKDERLANVAQIINKYSEDNIRIQLAPELGDRLLTVTFSDNNPLKNAELICLALNLQQTQQDNIVYITGSK